MGSLAQRVIYKTDWWSIREFCAKNHHLAEETRSSLHLWVRYVMMTSSCGSLSALHHLRAVASTAVQEIRFSLAVPDDSLSHQNSVHPLTYLRVSFRRHKARPHEGGAKKCHAPPSGRESALYRRSTGEGRGGWAQSVSRSRKRPLVPVEGQRRLPRDRLHGSSTAQFPQEAAPLPRDSITVISTIWLRYDQLNSLLAYQP